MWSMTLSTPIIRHVTWVVMATCRIHIHSLGYPISWHVCSEAHGMSMHDECELDGCYQHVQHGNGMNGNVYVEYGDLDCYHDIQVFYRHPSTYVNKHDRDVYQLGHSYRKLGPQEQGVEVKFLLWEELYAGVAKRLIRAIYLKGTTLVLLATRN